MLSEEKRESLWGVYLFMSPSVFPGLSGSSLRGCDTKSYKASIMKSKAGAKGADDIQTVGHLAARAPGILS